MSFDVYPNPQEINDSTQWTAARTATALLNACFELLTAPSTSVTTIRAAVPAVRAFLHDLEQHSECNGVDVWLRYYAPRELTEAMVISDVPSPQLVLSEWAYTGWFAC